MNWLTFVIILLFAFCFWLGMKKGLIKMVYSIGILIAGFVLTIVLSPVVSSFLHHNDSIYQFVYQAVEENISLEGKGKTLRQENLMIDNLPLPEMLRQKLKENNNEEVYQAMAVTSFKTYIYKYVTNMILNGISYFSVYLCITIILCIVGKALDLVSKLPVLKELNQLAGGIIGLVQALLMFWLFCTILAIFSNTQWAQNLYKMINESIILSTLYNGNFLMKIITNLKNTFF